MFLQGWQEIGEAYSTAQNCFLIFKLFLIYWKEMEDIQGNLFIKILHREEPIAWDATSNEQ